MKSRPTVLVADDHPVVADALANSLARWFRVIGAVMRLADLDAAIIDGSPEVVLLDLEFGKENSLPILPRLVAAYPKTKFVILTAHAEPVLADAALRAGAIGYVVKQSAASELRIAIEEALAGRTYLTPLLQARGAGKRPSGMARTRIVLSPRQSSILGLLRAGNTYRAISDQLCISSKTVEYHIESIGRLVGVTGKAQLVRWADENLDEDG